MIHVGKCKDRRSGIYEILTLSAAMVCGCFAPGRPDDNRACNKCLAFEHVRYQQRIPRRGSP